MSLRSFDLGGTSVLTISIISRYLLWSNFQLCNWWNHHYLKVLTEVEFKYLDILSTLISDIPDSENNQYSKFIQLFFAGIFFWRF